MKTKTEQESQQVLINNLKKKLMEKRDKYSEMIYRAAILEVADELFPVSDENYLNISYLPNVSQSSFNKVVSPFASIS